MEREQEQDWAGQLERDRTRSEPRRVDDARKKQVTEALDHYTELFEQALQNQDEEKSVQAAQKILDLRAEEIAMKLSREALLYGEPLKETVDYLMDEYGVLVATLEHRTGKPLVSSFS